MVPVPGEGPLPPPVSRERPGVGKEGGGGLNHIKTSGRQLCSVTKYAM